MQIEVVSISPVENRTGSSGVYRTITVTYKSGADGKVDSKLLVDFKYPAVFEFFLKAQAKDRIEVTSVKEGKYWSWTAAVPAVQSASAPAKEGSKWVPEEVRQRSIERQVAVKAAVDFYKERAGNFSVSDVVRAAASFEYYISTGNLIGDDESEEVN